MIEKKTDPSEKFVVASLLKTGEENAIKGSILAERLDVKIRKLYSMIEQERREGACICASDRGFYIARDMQELQGFYVRYLANARTMFYNMQAIRSILTASEGQLELSDLEDMGKELQGDGQEAKEPAVVCRV